MPLHLPSRPPVAPAARDLTTKTQPKPNPNNINESNPKRTRLHRYLDDGAFLAVKAVIELVRLRLSGCDVTSGGCDLTALLRELKEPLDAAEIRIKIKARRGDPRSRGAGAARGEQEGGARGHSARASLPRPAAPSMI